jgi:hypothetical protein
VEIRASGGTAPLEVKALEKLVEKVGCMQLSERVVSTRCCKTSTARASGLMWRNRLEPSTEEGMPRGISSARLRACNSPLS